LGILAAYLLLRSPTEATAQGKEQVSFIKDVAPILKEYCFACHDSKKRSGKYDMTSFEKILAGGSSGDPITAGKSADSEFYTLLVTTDERRMPPRKDNLSPVPKAKAEIIKKWIDQGAKLDQGLDAKGDLVKELRVRWTPPTPPVSYKFPAILNAMSFSPDGKQLVVGGHHELTVWEVESSKLLKRVYTRAERAYGMVFLPDGKLAVAGGRPGQEGDVRIYDLSAPGKDDKGVQILNGVSDPKVMLKQLLDVDDSVLCLNLSPDGKKLAAGGCDRIVRVWDISGGFATAKLEQTIENHADWVLAVAFAPDGKHLLTGSRDKTAKVWDLAAKESILTFPEHQAPVFGVAIKSDSKVGYSAGADKQVRMWNAQGEGKQVKGLGGHGDEIIKLYQHPSKPIFVTSSADKTVKVWDSNTGATTKTLSGMNDHIFSVAIDPEGTLVAAGAYDGEVKIWKIADGAISKSWNASPGYVAPAPPKK
jgi:WD40 repeat protein